MTSVVAWFKDECETLTIRVDRDQVLTEMLFPAPGYGMDSDPIARRSAD